MIPRHWHGEIDRAEVLSRLFVAFLAIECIIAAPCDGNNGGSIGGIFAVFDLHGALDLQVVTDPVGEIVFSLSGNFASIVETLTSLAGSGSEVVERAATQFLAVIQQVTGHLGSAVDLCSTLPIGAAFTLLTSIVETLSVTIGPDATAIICDSLTSLTSSLEGLFSLVGDIRATIHSAGKITEEIVAEIAYALEAGVHVVAVQVQIVTDIAACVLHTASEVINPVVVQAIAEVTTILTIVLNTVICAVQIVIVLTIQAISVVIETAKAIVSSATQVALGVVTTATQLITPVIETVVGTLNTASNSLTAVISGVTVILTGTVDTAVKTVSGVVSQVTTVISSVKSIVCTATETLSLVTNILEELSELSLA